MGPENTEKASAASVISVLLTSNFFLCREEFAKRLQLGHRLLSARKEKRTTEGTENTEKTSVALCDLCGENLLLVAAKGRARVNFL